MSEREELMRVVHSERRLNPKLRKAMDTYGELPGEIDPEAAEMELLAVVRELLIEMGDAVFGINCLGPPLYSSPELADYLLYPERDDEEND